LPEAQAIPAEFPASTASRLLGHRKIVAGIREKQPPASSAFGTATERSNSAHETA
jgi:hypothetical protein